MNVLLVTDLSEAGLTSVQGLLACGARGFGVVTLLHVIDLDLYTAGGSVPQLQEWAASELEKVASTLRDTGFQADVRIEVGPLMESIRKVANETDAGLVVTTNLGENAVVGRFLGSTAERLPAATERPVLIERVGHDGERWCRAGSASPFARVLLGFDLTDDVAALLDRLMRLPGVETIRMMHVAEDDAARLAAEQRAAAAVAAAPSTSIAIDYVIEEGDPAVVLLDHARSMDATVISVAACRHSMWRRGVMGSVARAVTTRADRATLVLPAEA